MITDNKKIIIDTDPGTDDALALAVFAVKASKNLVALVSTYGNVKGTQTYSNLINLAKLLKLNIKVIKGAMCPLGKDSFVSTDFHGSDGLGGVKIPCKCPLLLTDKADNFTKELYETIKSNGKVSYIALGPLTNLALLLSQYSDVTDYIEELVIMGGGLKVFNVNGNAEYNFSLDAEADRIVLKSKIEKVLAPLDLTHTLAFNQQEIEKIINQTRTQIESQLNELSAYSVMAQILFKNLDASLKHDGCDGAVIHDASTVAYILNSNQAEVSEFCIDVGDDGSVFESLNGMSVKIIRTLNKEYMFDLFSEVFNKLREQEYFL